ncbi:deadbeat [Musca autumnalis]|uniref:deadbeat n=1 Tax=Musca autumnalis TaxID=221902 RepID=UPI003CF2B4D7
MSLTFGKTKINNFAHLFQENPRAITRHPYVNFLRYYKQNHPRYDLKKLLHYGLIAWRKLSLNERSEFNQKNVLEAIQCPAFKLPRPEAGKNIHRTVAPPRPIIPQRYKRRSLSSRRNIRRIMRKSKYLPKRR